MNGVMEFVIGAVATLSKGGSHPPWFVGIAADFGYDARASG
jgi:hypothetical protein